MLAEEWNSPDATGHWTQSVEATTSRIRLPRFWHDSRLFQPGHRSPRGTSPRLAAENRFMSMYDMLAPTALGDIPAGPMDLHLRRMIRLIMSATAVDSQALPFHVLRGRGMLGISGKQAGRDTFSDLRSTSRRCVQGPGTGHLPSRAHRRASRTSEHQRS